ncbi:unnamed protein product, partial [Effrenium voratum]
LDQSPPAFPLKVSQTPTPGVPNAVLMPPPAGMRYQLGLHFLGISRPQGWLERLEREPEYELIIQAGEVGKRLRPRIPAPPATSSGGVSEEELRGMVPGGHLLRLEERTAVRLGEPINFACIEVWEERAGLLGSSRKQLGQCYVPLEQRFNKRLCTWSITNADQEVGFVVCRFFLGTTPAPVRSLHVVTGTCRANELRLVWEPPLSDGDLPLRGYRVEAREPQSGARLGGSAGFFSEPRTASAPASSEPQVTLTNLAGNTVYIIRVWAVNEAGAGPAAEVMGQTGPVAPGLCGLAKGATDEEALSLEWEPPGNSGGADLVAYRVWLRPVFQDGLGGFAPADSFIDLGLFEHQGAGNAVQKASVRLDQLQSCSGCLCSVAAINSAGLTGQSREAPVVWASVDRGKEIFELGSSPTSAVSGSLRDKGLPGAPGSFNGPGSDQKAGEAAKAFVVQGELREPVTSGAAMPKRERVERERVELRPPERVSRPLNWGRSSRGSLLARPVS